ncbi:hypothetical protein EDB83DRAFT_2334344 [Lactarius deliciosus]|nr:hypothetical protein EDB83DRAFT_2334344 [Lactarius deliciosus]
MMTVLTRCLLCKGDLAGWEVMELFAWRSKPKNSPTTIGTLLSDDDAPVDLRHEVLQLAILSPGAYLLREDLTPAIVAMIRGPETGKFTFEALLLLALLSNFHKSDAARLNPFLRHIGEITDVDVLRRACHVFRAYQDISDDSPPTVSSMIGSFMSSLRPDRAFSSTPVNTPKELFKNQPIEACIILLPIFEPSRPPLPHTIVSLSSYLLTHATSTSSRAIAYANVALNILLAMVETKEVIRVFCEPSPAPSQALHPMLPFTPSPRPLICAVLDCCILWLRHNLHKRLETSLYLTCVRTCHQTIWFLQKEHIRLDYHWSQLWKAIIGLLDFLGGKFDELTSTTGIEQLLQESLVLLDIASSKAEIFLPSPQAIHEYVYELVRSASALRRLTALLRSFISRAPSAPLQESPSEQALSSLLYVTNYYEEKVGTKNRSASSAMHIVAKEIERDGIHSVSDSYAEDPPSWSEGVTIFFRHVYSDGMALMP